jgi:hypothetical protein
MSRSLGLFVALCLALASGPAAAQVFKPKASTSSKKSSDSKKADPAAKKSSAKKQSRNAPSKKRVTTKPKKNQAAERGRPDDLTPDPASKESDKDFVKITDDDDVE